MISTNTGKKCNGANILLGLVQEFRYDHNFTVVNLILETVD